MTRRVDWTGIYPAALTMFDAQGRLDEEATAAHLDALVRQGAHGARAGCFAGLGAPLRQSRRTC